MKIIDILNIVAQGGVPPKKIEVFGFEFIYTEDKRPQRMYKMLEQDNYLLRDFVYTLNTKVEVIEEDKKIEKLENKIDTTFENYNYSERMRLTEIVNKINELVEEVNKLKNNSQNG